MKNITLVVEQRRFHLRRGRVDEEKARDEPESFVTKDARQTRPGLREIVPIEFSASLPDCNQCGEKQDDGTETSDEKDVFVHVLRSVGRGGVWARAVRGRLIVLAGG